MHSQALCVCVCVRLNTTNRIIGIELVRDLFFNRFERSQATHTHSSDYDDAYNRFERFSHLRIRQFNEIILFHPIRSDTTKEKKPKQ